MLAAAPFQLVRSHPAAGEVVRRHAGDGYAEKAVDGHKRDVLRDFQMRVVGQRDDAVRAVLTHELNDVLLALAVVFRKEQQHFVIAPLQRRVDMMGQQGEVGEDGVGYDKGDGIGAVGLERTRTVVDLIIELLDRGLDLQAVALAHALAVDDLGHRAQRYAGLAGDVAHGRGGLFGIGQGITSQSARKENMLSSCGQYSMISPVCKGVS